MSVETTTIEIKTDLWAALDRRKERGESFDDVIRRLIEATPAGVGALEGPHFDAEFEDPQLIDAGSNPDKGCAHYDVIAGQECGEPVEYKQRWRYEDKDEWKTFYYCEEHAPTDAFEE